MGASGYYIFFLKAYTSVDFHLGIFFSSIDAKNTFAKQNNYYSLHKKARIENSCHTNHEVQ